MDPTFIMSKCRDTKDYKNHEIVRKIELETKRMEELHQLGDCISKYYEKDLI